MEPQVTRGEAVPVVEIRGKDAFYVNEKALMDILLNDNIKDLPVVVISIAGAYRTGKSFMLNFFLRYLRSGCKDDWFQERDAALVGFPWSRGSERNTEGILLWNQVFRVTTPTKQEVAVLLIDTQGSFDRMSSKAETVAFFAISALVSSVMVYNVSKNIQEDHLEHLWLCAHYAQLARKGGSGKSIQKLIFLVRDWNFPFDAQYGAEGGKKLLKRRLTDSSTQSTEMCEVENQFTSFFEAIDCFLIPHPGLQMIQKKEFCGALADLDEDFTQHLKELISILLAPENLVVKNVKGKRITCQELIALFQEYAGVFNQGSLPIPKSLTQANAKQQLEMAKRKGIELYESIMEQRCGHIKASPVRSELESAQNECGQPKDYCTEEELDKAHEEAIVSALDRFDSTPKLNCGALVGEYREKMTKAIQEEFEVYFNLNRMKIAIDTMKKNAESTEENAEGKEKPWASVVGTLLEWLPPWSRSILVPTGIGSVVFGAYILVHKYG